MLAWPGAAAEAAADDAGLAETAGLALAGEAAAGKDAGDGAGPALPQPASISARTPANTRRVPDLPFCTEGSESAAQTAKDSSLRPGARNKAPQGAYTSFVTSFGSHTSSSAGTPSLWTASSPRRMAAPSSFGSVTFSPYAPLAAASPE
jgi:hypothetical protein